MLILEISRFADNSGVQWKIVEVEGGHEAFLTKPQGIADIMLNGIKQLQGD